MDWKDEELNEGERVMTYPVSPPKDSTHRRETVRAIMTRAVELAAARGGTMTVEEVNVWLEVHGPLMPLAASHLSALGAHNAVLEAEVARLTVECETINDLHTKATERLSAAEEGNRELVRRAQQAEALLEREQESARMWSKRAIAAVEEHDELKARCATLSAAGQVLSAHVDRCECPSEGHDPSCQNEPLRRLYPCSATCTHDDAATPGHPERVRERSEAVKALSEKILPGPDVVDGGPETRGPVRVVSSGARDMANAYAEGAEAMRAACLEAVRMVLQGEGVSEGGPSGMYERFKAAIKGAVP